MLRSATLAVFLLTQTAFAFECGGKSKCSQMESCAEAQFHLQQCGLQRLDGDNDGSPCEKLCGDGAVQAPVAEFIGNIACGSKRKCGQMESCEEAQFYLKSCGVRSLDRDNDGQACESLCN